MHHFCDDDEGYLRWIAGHPDGFVLNVERAARPGYAVLHRATCATISTVRHDGAYTERGYRKVAASDLNDLRAISRSSVEAMVLSPKPAAIAPRCRSPRAPGDNRKDNMGLSTCGTIASNGICNPCGTKAVHP